ncbi:MAG: cytochrome [Verrucomicrobiaceae bacterium]|nr:cytochrome [Verrucomicrobiaceae bacterium]
MVKNRIGQFITDIKFSSKIKYTKPIIFFGLLFGAFSAHANTGDAARGQQLYQSRCTACHAVDGNREGPAHRGVFGRKAGSVADFNYSSALKSSHVVWNEKTLDSWLTNPEVFIPGQKMDFLIPEANDRADIISYLRTLSAH